MNAYIVDGGVLRRHPEVLGLANAERFLFTHLSVLSELESLAQKGTIQPGLVNLVLQYEATARIWIDRSDFSYLQKSGGAVSQADALVELAKNKAPAYAGVTIVTDDAALASQAAASSVSVVSPKDFLRNSPALSTQNPDIANVITAESRQNRRQFLAMGIAALVVVLAYPYLPVALKAIVSRGGAIVAVASVALSGTLLFFFRSRFKLAYGSAEFLVGVMLGYQVYLDAKSETFLLDLSTALKFLAGLYVIVRGMDNIGKSPQKVKFSRNGTSCFPGECAVVCNG
jgi:hypothetical protein